MATYTQPTISNYNDNAPTNDGSQDISANGLNWDRHIDEIGDPLKDYIDAVNSAVDTAFDAVDASKYISVLTYDADNTGATSASTAVQNCINAVEAAGGGTIYFPAGDYQFDVALTVTEPITFVGDGWGTNLYVSDDIQLITVSAGSVLNRENNNPGVSFLRIRFNGISPAQEAASAPWTRSGFPDAGCLKFQNVDQVVVENCYFLNFRQSAIWFDTKCREHLIRRNYFRYNGDLTASQPTIKIVESSDSADPHNNIFFEANSIAYSLGDTVLIDTNASNSSVVRNIHFLNNFIHGLVDTIDDAPYSHTGYTAFHHFNVGDCEGLRLFDNSITTAGDDTPCVLFQEGSGASKSRWHQIRGGRMVQHYDLTAGNAPAVKLEGATNGADVAIDGVLFTGHNTIFQDAASTKIYLGINNVYPTGLNVWESSMNGTMELTPNYNGGATGNGVKMSHQFLNLILAPSTTTGAIDGNIRWNGERLRIYDTNATAERDVRLNEVRTTANLVDEANDANTVGKYQGKIVYATDNNTLYVADGAGVNDIWVKVPTPGTGDILPA